VKQPIPQVIVAPQALAVEITGARGPAGSNSFSRGVSVLNPAGPLDIVGWRAPFACTVTALRGYRVGGSGAAVNARKAGSGTHLAANLSLDSAGAWIAGGAVQNASYAAGDTLEFMLASVAGGPSQVAIQVEFTRAEP